MMKTITDILSQNEFDKNDLQAILGITDKTDLAALKAKGYEVMKEQVGEKVYLRGLIEFSNYCAEVTRFNLTKAEILDSAIWCAEKGYGSVVLQSGERYDESFVSFVEDCVYEIKEKTKSESQPDGLGITLCVGELNQSQYERLFKAGAHRYLLRVETTSPRLFKMIHPEKQSLDSRIDALRILKEVGYHVGTGVMIGLPEQTDEDLADDLLFFKDLDIDMIGMGPYIVHLSTPMNIYRNYYFENQRDIYAKSLKMIAAARLLLKDVNIASTTALQAMYPWGREEGLLFGANVIMPNLTPPEARKEYILYTGKPCLDEFQGDCFKCVTSRIESTGRKVALNEWGDSMHYLKRRG
jgi:biotin synthase